MTEYLKRIIVNNIMLGSRCNFHNTDAIYAFFYLKNEDTKSQEKCCESRCGLC